MSIDIRTYEPSSAKLKALVYGASAIGKTVFGATAPKPLFISAEAGAAVRRRQEGELRRDQEHAGHSATCTPTWRKAATASSRW